MLGLFRPLHVNTTGVTGGSIKMVNTCHQNIWLDFCSGKNAKSPSWTCVGVRLPIVSLIN